MLRFRVNRPMAFGVAAALIAVSALTVSGLRMKTAPVRTLPTSSLHSGTEVLAVLIVSSTCEASHDARLPEALTRIRARLASQAAREGKRFYLIGVAIDHQPSDGISFLTRFGSFDEVVAGRGWFGTGSIDYIVRGLPGPRATPQLLVLERDIVVGLFKKASSDREVTRQIGVNEIVAFAEALDALPTTMPERAPGPRTRDEASPLGVSRAHAIERHVAVAQHVWRRIYLARTR